MKPDTKVQRLRALLARPEPLILPGIHDGLSAVMAQAAGFEAAFVSGAGVSMSRLGLADMAFLSVTELCDCVRAMSHASGLPLLVDMDTGFGNALNAARCMVQLERAGAAGVQMEDQTAPKRCGHMSGKNVVSGDEMAGKIRAVCEARTNPDTVVIARTDALGVNGLLDALARCDLYIEAGADALFVEAPKTVHDMKAIAAHVNRRVPLVHNFVEGGTSPISNGAELLALGYKVGLFPLLFLHAGVPAQQALLDHLHKTGSTHDWSGPMADLAALSEIVGLESLLETGRHYAASDT
jgi:2-methylisocitrate lyase-like PEP mutase family enzyme